MAATRVTTNLLWAFCLPLFVFIFVHIFINMSLLRSRSSLVRNIVTKLEAERELEEMDRSIWYKVDITKMKPEISTKFVQLEEDEETTAFIKHSFEQSDWVFTQLYYNVAKSFLSFFYCQTDINGMLNRGSMFVFSKDQLLKLSSSLTPPPFTETLLPSLLDLGAGDGRPTTSMSGFFLKTFVTEVSSPMRKLCSERGFTVLELDNWAVEPGAYDVISALNLFDRCDKPLSIIKDIHSSLKDEGLLIVALVLPFQPYVESVPSHRPSEMMSITGNTFADQVTSTVDQFERIGFKLERWSRVPYLCEGDLSKPIYHLNNGLFLFTKVHK